MINLIPNDVKKNLTYGRRNLKLRQWSGLFLLGILGIVIIVASGLFYMQKSINDLSSQNSKTQQELADEQLDSTQKQVQNISSSLKLVVQVLSREVLFSDLLKQIGGAIPPNANLTSLEIDKTQGAIDITAIATNYNAATQVQINLQDPANKIFDKADIINITCSKTAPDPHYPCTINIRAQFAKSNPFLFINSGAKL